MSPLSWFDHRTLLACQFLVLTLFAAVFLWLRRAYPQARGVGVVAWSFVTGVFCTLMMVLQGYSAPFLSVTAANLLGVVAYLGTYEGVVQFTGARSRLRWLAGAAAVAVGVAYYFSAVRPQIVPRMVVMGLVTALIRGAMAWVLLGLADGAQSTEKVMQRTWGARLLLGSFLALLTVFGVERVMVTTVGYSADGFTQRNTLQTSAMALNVVYIAVFGMCFLVMSSQELIARSEENSERDVLSGVLNRRGIEERLTQELKRSGRNGQRLCVALVDVDRFKAINDAMGHAMGDAVLQAIAKAMTGRLRDMDFLGRYGGDEFLVVLPNTMLQNTPLVAERLSLEVGRLKVLGDRERVTLSIGITEASPEDDTLALIARADEALYEAKRAGRSCWRMVAPERTYPMTVPEYEVRMQA